MRMCLQYTISKLSKNIECRKRRTAKRNKLGTRKFIFKMVITCKINFDKPDRVFYSGQEITGIIVADVKAVIKVLSKFLKSSLKIFRAQKIAFS